MIINDHRKNFFHRCPNRKHFMLRTDDGDAVKSKEVIKTYYSEQHAKDDGWRKTNHIMFCGPGKNFVWVCPECAKEVEWEEKKSVEFSSRKTKEDRRKTKEDRRKINTYYIENDKRKGPQRDQDRRGRAQRKTDKKNRQKFERHLKAQR